MRIFLSYSSGERELAERVVVALRAEGHVVFFDRHTLRAGEAFHAKIRAEIRRSRLMVFLISPSSVGAFGYPRSELRIAEREWGSPVDRVVPVMASPTSITDVPAFIREVNIIEAGAGLISEVSYEVDRIVRVRRRRMKHGVMLLGLVVLMAGAIWEAVSLDGCSAIDEGEGGAPEALEDETEGEGPMPPDVGAQRNVPIGDGVTISMVRIKGGTFPRGSTGGAGHEHEVTVSGYWIGEMEVTQEQWRAVMKGKNSDSVYGEGSLYPVNNVSWEDAVEFANEVSSVLDLPQCYKREGQGWRWERHCSGIRLPTEAEWEYAARAGSRTLYSFGDDERQLCAYANFADRATQKAHPQWGWASDICHDGHGGLAPGDALQPNPWGLRHVHGNVWEWVWDWYGPYPRGRVIDSRGPRRGDQRVLRGGSLRK